MSRYAPHHRSSNQPRATSSTVCQKCLKTGHFIYECKSTRPYVSRPSRTEQLENPNLLAKLKAAGKPSVEVPEEFKKKEGTANRILAAREKEREETAAKAKGKERERGSKKARRSSRSSSSDSDSESDSSSSSTSGSESSSDSRSGSERSRERDRTRRVPGGRRRSRSTSRSRSRSRSP